MHRFIARSLLIAPFLFAGLLLPADAFGQKKKRGNVAYTDPAKADADFALQGEYLGAFVEEGWGTQLGLQVVARGDGNFLVVEYDGGLPGTGWKQPTRHNMNGKVDDGVIRVQSPKHRFAITAEAAEVRGKSGERLGKLVKVHRISPTLGKRPPSDALVLFDGKDAGEFKDAKVTSDGLLQEGTETVRKFNDFTMHLEFQLSYMPFARGQGRANSGVYVQRRYEIQVLDSFGLDGKANECGGLYTVRPPDLNMCLPPLQWQTYDLTIRSPLFDENGEKTHNARLTVRHNGVLIHDNVEIPNKTGAGKPEGPDPLPILLQNHRNPIRFRNIWLVEHELRKPDEIAAKPRPAARQARTTTGGRQR